VSSDDGAVRPDGRGRRHRPVIAAIGSWLASADRAPDDAPPAYRRYMDRAEIPIDILTLCTIWLVVLPFIGSFSSGEGWWFAARGLLSLVYLADLVIRTRLAGPHQHYVFHHPIALASVLLPPVRIFLSVRLFRRLFRRGNLVNFLGVAALLVLNGAIIVWAFERDAPGASITTPGNAVWWAIVTVTTVGYGDYVPITTGGKVTASVVLMLGILTIAVVTATVASRFRDQASGSGRESEDEPADAGSNSTAASSAELAELIALRDRLDAVIRVRAAERGD
jgi:voltage-gated potassium channel